LWFTPQHIAGVDNVEADYQSRVFNDNSEWMLAQHVFKGVTNTFGTPTIDLFASRLNHQLDQYGAWFPDPGAKFVNSLKEFWGDLGFIYCFPPFCIIAKVCQKILNDDAEGILIVPNWPSQPWFNLIRRMQVGKPMIIDLTDDNLYLPFQTNYPVRRPPGRELRALQFSARCFRARGSPQE
jgi:hypothetical protein